MFKKFIILSTLILSLGEAVTLNSYSNMMRPHHNTPTFTILYDQNEIKTHTDWVAIYKANTSTAWQNVLYWRWVKDLFWDNPSSEELRFGGTALDDLGEYEVRFFKENSYIADKTLPFTVTKKVSFTFLENIFIAPHYLGPNNLLVYLNGISSNSPANQTDWLGLYKVGTSNDLENAIRWFWISNLPQHQHNNATRTALEFNYPPLEGGDYEIRYFLNNSYQVEMKSRPFHIHYQEIESSQPTLDVEDLSPWQIRDSLTVYIYNLSGNTKDWIAVFNKGAERIRENIIEWTYNSEGLLNGQLSLYNKGIGGVTFDKEYDIVLFSNDTYNEITSITIKTDTNDF